MKKTKFIFYFRDGFENINIAVYAFNFADAVILVLAERIKQGKDKKIIGYREVKE